MDIELPESSRLDPPYEVKGPTKEAKASFYELAKSRIRFLNKVEFDEYVNKLAGKKLSSTAVGPVWVNIKLDENNKIIEKFVKNLEIVIDKDDFIINGKSYEDIIPYVIEHELFEAWLNAKKGFMGADFSLKGFNRKHELALRKEFYLAEKNDMGEVILDWRTKKDPEKESYYKEILENTKMKLAKNMPM